MTRLTEADARAILAYLSRIYPLCQRDGFPAQILSPLRQLIPCDLMGYNEVEPSRQRALVVPDPPDSMEPVLLEAFARYTPEHPLIAHYARTGDSHAHMISDFLSQRELHRLNLYDAFFRHVNAEYQIAVSLAVRGSVVIGVALNRSQRDFSERDRRVLDLLSPHLVQAYRNMELATGLSEALETGLKGMVVVDRALNIHFADGQAERWLESYFGPASSWSGGLPDELAAWVQHQAPVAAEDGVFPVPAPFVATRPGRRIEVHLYRPSTPLEGLLLVFEERVVTSEREDLATCLRALGLTRRESEVMSCLIEGKSNDEIAERLTVTPWTVHKHLEHVYRKLGVQSRTAAIARVLDELRHTMGE